jgi:hypothetical protein
LSGQYNEERKKQRTSGWVQRSDYKERSWNLNWVAKKGEVKGVTEEMRRISGL